MNLLLSILNKVRRGSVSDTDFPVNEQDFVRHIIIELGNKHSGLFSVFSHGVVTLKLREGKGDEVDKIIEAYR